MDMVPDDETEGFSFIWTIQNFSYCLQKKGEPLSSPRFKLNLSDINEWSLFIYPRGDEQDDSIGIFLNVHSSGPFPIKVKNHFSIRTTNGTFQKKSERNILFIFERQCAKGFAPFLTNDELFKKGDDAFLENDTLTIRCRIQKEHPELPVSGLCYAQTLINVKRFFFLWRLENFKEILRNQRKTINFSAASSQTQSFTVAIFLSGEIYNEKKIQVEVKQNEPNQKSFLTCNLSLLDADGKTAQSVHDEYWFENSQETFNWHFSFLPLKKILDHEDLYLKNGALSLRCELAVSTGTDSIQTEYRVNKGQDKACYSKPMDTSLPGSWKDNFQQFYKEGKFSDLTVRTASSKEFPIHKAILCARSEVFNAMFEHDTTENRTNVIEIEDLNDDTISKMLLFIYSDIVEDLEWEEATQLYFAADKYGIVALKRECSTFLKDNMKSSNICEILVLADMHHDQDMKSAAQDFVVDHATEIIKSEYWKKFIKDKASLAAEAMHFMFMKNLKL